MGKWKSFPEAQHTPLCAHLLGLAMKTVTQLALGESFGDDTEVISFHKNHDAVRQLRGTSYTNADRSCALNSGLSLWSCGFQMGFLRICFSLLLTHRSGQKSGKATWTAPWRRAPAEKGVMRRVGEVCIVIFFSPPRTCCVLTCGSSAGMIGCGETGGEVCRGSDMISVCRA